MQRKITLLTLHNCYKKYGQPSPLDKSNRVVAAVIEIIKKEVENQGGKNRLPDRDLTTKEIDDLIQAIKACDTDKTEPATNTLSFIVDLKDLFFSKQVKIRVKEIQEVIQKAGKEIDKDPVKIPVSILLDELKTKDANPDRLLTNEELFMLALILFETPPDFSTTNSSISTELLRKFGPSFTDAVFFNTGSAKDFFSWFYSSTPEQKSASSTFSFMKSLLTARRPSASAASASSLEERKKDASHSSAHSSWSSTGADETNDKKEEKSIIGDFDSDNAIVLLPSPPEQIALDDIDDNGWFIFNEQENTKIKKIINKKCAGQKEAVAGRIRKSEIDEKAKFGAQYYSDHTGLHLYRIYHGEHFYRSEEGNLIRFQTPPKELHERTCLLGKGGNGAAKILIKVIPRQGDPEKQYAVLKTIAFEPSDEKAIARLKNEAELNKLQGIPFFYHIRKSPTKNENNSLIQAEIIMPYYPGPNLAEFKKNGYSQWPLDLQIEIMQKVDEEVRKLHEIGYLHRDITLRNIILMQTKYGLKVKLIDNEISIPYDRKTKQAQPEKLLKGNPYRGTPAYLSTKLGDNVRNRQPLIYSIETDLYALGMCAAFFLNLTDNKIDEADPKGKRTRTAEIEATLPERGGYPLLTESKLGVNAPAARQSMLKYVESMTGRNRYAYKQPPSSGASAEFYKTLLTTMKNDEPRPKQVYLIDINKLLDPTQESYRKMMESIADVKSPVQEIQLISYSQRRLTYKQVLTIKRALKTITTGRPIFLQATLIRLDPNKKFHELPDRLAQQTAILSPGQKRQYTFITHGLTPEEKNNLQEGINNIQFPPYAVSATPSLPANLPDAAAVATPKPLSPLARSS